MTEAPAAPPECLQPIPGLPGYALSPAYNVYRNGRRMKMQKDRNGSPVFSATHPGGHQGSVRLVRVVGRMFHPDFREELAPIFLDSNKWNLSADNVKWVSRAAVTRPPFSKTPRP